MTITVEEFISGKPSIVSVKLGDSVIDAVKLMLRHDYSQLPVIDSQARPIGFVTSDSILSSLHNYGVGLGGIRIKHVLRKKPQQFRQDIDLLDLFDEMDDPFVCIVDGEGRLVQVLTTFDTTTYFRQRARDILLVENIENILKDYVQLAFASKNDGEFQLNKAVQAISNSDEKLKSSFTKALQNYLGKAQPNGGSKVDPDTLDDVFDRYLATKEPPATFDDLTLANYVSLFLHNDNWGYLEGVLGLEKVAITNLLNAVRLTRNDLAHFREIESDQSHQLRDCYDLLVDHQEAINRAFSSQDDPTIESIQPVSEASGLESETFSPIEEEPQPGESRYAPLAIWLQQRPLEIDLVKMPFAQVEEVIGAKLPASAYKNRAWWANDSIGHVQSKHWLDVGWRVAGVNMSEEMVRFSRIQDRQRGYIDFYNLVADELRKLPGYEQTAFSPAGTNWHSIKYISGGGRVLAGLNFAFGRGGILRVELYIDSGDSGVNKSLFDALRVEKNDIEEEVGNELEWQRLDNRRASRVARVFKGSITDSSDELHSLAEEAAAAMAILTKVLEPRVINIGQHLLSSIDGPSNSASGSSDK